MRCGMEIYMIRHGVTEWNKLMRLQGQTDIPLEDAGRELAVRVGHALKEIPFTRVISSPLQRAVETAKLVIMAAGKAVEFQTDDRLKEISFGDWEGYSATNPDYPSPDPEFRNFFEHPELYHAPSGGESFEQLLERTGDFLKELASRQECENETILVSVHGAVMRGLLANIKHSDLADFWGPGVPENCAVAIARTQQGCWELIQQDVIYLERR